MRLRHALARLFAGEVPSVGSFLTDGRRLVRVEAVLGQTHRRKGLVLALEDCRTLAVLVCPARGLGEAGFRRVACAPSGPAQERDSRRCRALADGVR